MVLREWQPAWQKKEKGMRGEPLERIEGQYMLLWLIISLFACRNPLVPPGYIPRSQYTIPKFSFRTGCVSVVYKNGYCCIRGAELIN